MSDIIYNDKSFMKIYDLVQPYTMTSLERVYSLYQAVRYIHYNNIPGDLVECGVWRGGSAMTMALTLKELGDFDRNIYMYDTFEGMTQPREIDVDVFGDSAVNLYNQNNAEWCIASFDEVKQNLSLTGYPDEKLKFVRGLVENTIPNTIPKNISLLRLDTDWFDSTYHELVHLYPVLAVNGILIIDDYGHWQGAKKAVDEYFTKIDKHLLFNRIDYTGRLAIKI